MSQPYARTTDTPDGPFSIVAGETAVIASGWTPDITALVALIPAPIRPQLWCYGQSPVLDQAAAALEAYYAGEPEAILVVPVTQPAGAFQQRLRDALRAIPAGSTSTYAELASRAGSPRATRAAGTACARNATALFVPCHRAVRSDGGLGGFLYGLDIKRSLLARERDHLD